MSVSMSLCVIHKDNPSVALIFVKIDTPFSDPHVSLTIYTGASCTRLAALLPNMNQVQAEVNGLLPQGA